MWTLSFEKKTPKKHFLMQEVICPGSFPRCGPQRVGLHSAGPARGGPSRAAVLARGQRAHTLPGPPPPLPFPSCPPPAPSRLQWKCAVHAVHTFDAVLVLGSCRTLGKLNPETGGRGRRSRGSDPGAVAGDDVGTPGAVRGPSSD